MTPEPTIVVDHVRKRFRLYRRRETTLKAALLRRTRAQFEEFWAVDDVSFAVQPGETLGIFGRNGSGKSTMLKLLARILRPDAGSVSVRGRVSALLEVGAGFHPEYTAVENIFLSGAIYGLSKEELRPRVDEIIAFAQLERFADNPVKTYSSGMYARLGFSIAVNVDPDVLLIDEVLSVGDESFRARCYERMLEFRDAGKTLVLVSHDLGAIESFCDRAIWLDGGTIRALGRPESIVKQYIDLVTAEDEAWSRGQIGKGLVQLHAPVNRTVPIVLAGMALAGDDGGERDLFHNGEPMRIRVRYEASNPVHAPSVEMTITRHDGAAVATSSSKLGGLEVGDILEGTGTIDWLLDPLLLVPGSYYISVRLFDQTGLHVLDEQERWFRFQVRAGAYRETHGVVVLPAIWEHRRD